MIQMIINIALKFIAMYLAKNADKAEANRAFLDFIDAMNKEGLASVRLKQSTEDQIDELKKRKEEMYQNGDGTTVKPTIDPSKVQIVIPAAVKVGQQFEVQIYGVKDVPFLRVMAEQKNPLSTARWNEEKKCYVGTAVFNSVLGGVRKVGFELNAGWVEKDITVSV